jgi:hypothetical protein
MATFVALCEGYLGTFHYFHLRCHFLLVQLLRVWPVPNTHVETTKLVVRFSPAGSAFQGIRPSATVFLQQVLAQSMIHLRN